MTQPEGSTDRAGATGRDRPHVPRRRRAVFFLLCFLLYVLLHFALSRAAARTQPWDLGGDTYMYVDFGPGRSGPGRPRWERGCRYIADGLMGWFFYPVRVVDENLLGGPQHCRHIDWLR
jgi:hypothetical protein